MQPSKQAGEQLLQPLFCGAQDRCMTLRKRPFGTIFLEQILAQIPLWGLVASMDLKDIYFHSQIALHHRHFLRFALEGTAYQYSVLLFELALAPHTLSKCMDAAPPHLTASMMRVLNYLDDWLILAQSRDMPASHIDKLLRHLEVLRLCVNMRKSFLAPSQSITYLGVCFDLKRWICALASLRNARPSFCLQCAISN